MLSKISQTNTVYHLYVESNKYHKLVNITKKKQEFPCGLVIQDVALSLLWYRFSPWPGNLCMSQTQSKKEKNQPPPKKKHIHRYKKQTNQWLPVGGERGEEK